LLAMRSMVRGQRESRQASADAVRTKNAAVRERRCLYGVWRKIRAIVLSSLVLVPVRASPVPSAVRGSFVVLGALGAVGNLTHIHPRAGELRRP